MGNQNFMAVYDLEQAGEPDRAWHLLNELGDAGDPLALLELATRYISTDGFTHPVHRVTPDRRKSDELAIRAKQLLERRAEAGDGDAMRTLACTYLGHWHPLYEVSGEKAECWLLKAFDANCYFAANDLASFYQEQDVEKAKYWYRMAERHNCRVIYSEKLEPAK